MLVITISKAAAINIIPFLLNTFSPPYHHSFAERLQGQVFCARPQAFPTIDRVATDTHSQLMAILLTLTSLLYEHYQTSN
jgi:hypothetical protein